MRSIIILAAICTLAFAEPVYPGSSVLSYGYFGLPFAYHGGIMDTPEVAQAKATHLARQAYEAARNRLGYAHVPVVLPAYTSGPAAPIGSDGRVVDTPEVAEAKAAHLTAHALETAKQAGLYPYGALAFSSIPYAYGHAYGAPLGPDGKVVDTPEVAQAKATHLLAHAQESLKTTGKH